MINIGYYMVSEALFKLIEIYMRATIADVKILESSQLINSIK